MGTMADHMIATYREKAEKWTQQACTLDLSRKDAGWIFRIEVAYLFSPSICGSTYVLLVIALSAYRCAIVEGIPSPHESTGALTSSSYVATSTDYAHPM